MAKPPIWGHIHTQHEYSKLEGGELTLSNTKSEPNAPSRWSETTWRCICVFTFLSGIFMLLAAHRSVPSDKECTAQLSIWSPILEAVEYEQKDWTSGLSASEFSGPPTPELEGKWSEIANSGIVLIPPDRIPSLNRSIEQGFVEVTVRNSSGFIGEIEVFHHLHCLNFIRQYVWVDFYPEDQAPSLLKGNGESQREVNRLHVAHCIEVLRQALTCNADLTPYLMYKTPNGKSPVTEDFNASHMCKNFDRIMDWMKDNSAAEEWAEVRKEYFGHQH
ncbi:uncharacterized protein LY89DRAFT_708583 [Mollisia scopiformis]|uniref:Cyclochlorotine biosynthesis protein O n=1 Tax=Mollisia scopiformis TaxID=149040 RepID=A0A194X5I6_MOLSC|nr:uncharacterized protein LY89DRAFT_708583 [Mollisia scopiformis]KUJ15077.1 hypothetical protein LY89DRAFT_708583 [Mollisia scopiformis]